MAPQRFMTTKNAIHSNILSYYTDSYCFASWKPISDFLPNFLQKSGSHSGPYSALVCSASGIVSDLNCLVCYATGIISDLTNLAHSIAILNGHEFEKTLGDSEGRKPGILQSMESQKVRHKLSAEQQQCTTLSFKYMNIPPCLLIAFPIHVFPLFIKSDSHYSKTGDTEVEKAMAPHSNTLAWKIPWTEEPGRL